MTGTGIAHLITVSSPEFLLGTRVMLNSFLTANSWFDGKLVVLHSRLSEQEVQQLQSEFPRLICYGADQKLERAIDRLEQAFPHLSKRRDRFLSLQTLLSPGAWPRLFVDSDTLVQADLSTLLDYDGMLVACPDASMLRGRERAPDSFAEVDSDGSRKASFNAGLILLREVATKIASADELLAMLTPDRWQAIASDHTDQALWNLLFRNEVTLADPAFNFMVGHAGLYGDADAAAQKILHFNGPAKPWLPEAQLAAKQRGGVVADAFEAWREGLKSMLANRS